jgi:hypothetical protein
VQNGRLHSKRREPDTRQAERIQALAEKQGTSFSETIRNLVNIALPFAERGYGLDFARLVTILEFSSLALDTLVQKAAPEEADRLLDLAIEHAKNTMPRDGDIRFDRRPSRSSMNRRAARSSATSGPSPVDRSSFACAT